MKSRPPRSRQSLTDLLFGLGWHSGTAEGFAALTAREIERLMDAARKSSRWGHRDATMILIGYRHGLRASAATINVGTVLQFFVVFMANIGHCHSRDRFATARGDAPGVWACWGVLGGDGRLRGVRRLQHLPRPQ